ncbi:MAG: hypothetical protein JWP81_1872 [Ferruginibacter sp.]|nr:hypothetical protein [Ferruginibacter sp.]
MKKLLVFAVVAASFASCSNGEGDKKVEEVKSSDTTAVVSKDTAMVVKDTTVKTTTTIDTVTKK